MLAVLGKQCCEFLIGKVLQAADLVLMFVHELPQLFGRLLLNGAHLANHCGVEHIFLNFGFPGHLELPDDEAGVTPCHYIRMCLGALLYQGLQFYMKPVQNREPVCLSRDGEAPRRPSDFSQNLFHTVIEGGFPPPAVERFSVKPKFLRDFPVVQASFRD